MAEAIFRGFSGKLHRFTAYDPCARFAPAPAVYAFARPGAQGRGWVTLFLSRTANLADRMSNHESWEAASRLGATHVLVHQRDERDAREQVEADLLVTLRPILNGAPDVAPALSPMERERVVRLRRAA